MDEKERRELDLEEILKEFGITPHVYVPERADGYGLSEEAVDRIFEECNPELFITVDCGISCAKEAQYIYELGSQRYNRVKPQAIHGGR